LQRDKYCERTFATTLLNYKFDRQINNNKKENLHFNKDYQVLKKTNIARELSQQFHSITSSIDKQLVVRKSYTTIKRLIRQSNSIKFYYKRRLSSIKRSEEVNRIK